MRRPEINDALRLILSTPDIRADDQAILNFVEVALHRQIDLHQMQVALSGNKLLAAALPVLNAGKTVMLLTSTPGWQPGSAEGLTLCLDAAFKVYCARSNLTQILTELHQSGIKKASFAAGFEQLAVLIYLSRYLSEPVPYPELPAGMSILNYSPHTHDRFADAIMLSYEQSLDCPGMHGKRDIQDIIAGHQSSGIFDPNLWFLVTEGDVNLGVLLLSPISNTMTMELVYVGLSPIARGRKLGDFLVQLAFHQVQQARLQTLTLAVDVINSPALQLYYRHGLSEVARRLAMVRYV